MLKLCFGQMRRDEAISDFAAGTTWRQRQINAGLSYLLPGKPCSRRHDLPSHKYLKTAMKLNIALVALMATATLAGRSSPNDESARANIGCIEKPKEQGESVLSIVCVYSSGPRTEREQLP